MSRQSKPSSSSKVPVVDSDDDDSDFTTSTIVEDSDSTEEEEYEEGAEAKFEVSDLTALFLKEYITDVDYTLEAVPAESSTDWFLHLTTTPDSAKLHTEVICGLNLVLRIWPFSQLLEEYARDLRHNYENLMWDGIERLIILIEFAKLFENLSPITKAEVERITADDDAMKRAEAHIREVLEYNEGIDIPVKSFVEELTSLFTLPEKWRQTVPLLKERSFEKATGELIAKREYSFSNHLVLDLRMVSRYVRECVDTVMSKETRQSKTTFGILQSNIRKFQTVENSSCGGFIRHVDVCTAVKLMKFIRPTNQDVFLSVGYTSTRILHLVKNLLGAGSLANIDEFDGTEGWRFLQCKTKFPILKNIISAMVEHCKVEEINTGVKRQCDNSDIGVAEKKSKC